MTDYSTEREATPGTVLEALRRGAAQPWRPGISMFDRRGRPVGRRELTDLLEGGNDSAARLARIEVTDRTPLVIALPTSWEWIETWLAALSLGALPLAISPASPLGSADESLRRLAVLLERLRGRHIICTDQLRARLAERTDLPADLVALTPEELAAQPPSTVPRLSEPDPSATAFLQLTSGTTGDSRVVMITHRGATRNLAALAEATVGPLELPRGSAPLSVSWLPLYHDMGLVGTLLTAFTVAAEIRLMPPTAFLGRPATWLRALDAAQTSVATAPNFGYQFCVEKLRDRDLADLDLSNWRAALVGAEMVRPETLRAFAERTEGNGFDPRAYRPCYGMAEATLGVTMDVALEGPRTASIPGESGVSVSLGPPVAETELRIASPDGAELPEGSVGEIWVRGPGVFGGYYHDPEATRATMSGDWLKTGDLGFLRKGELFISGRIKDILVIRGQNLMPHELERLTENELGGGGTRRAAAFAVDHGAEGEQIVIVAEAPSREPDALGEIAQAVRRSIGEVLGMPVADLAFVRSLPRTTSGKVLRHQVRDDYVGRKLTRMDS